LHPNFVVFDVDVDGAAVDELVAIPTDVDDLVVVAFFVEDDFGFDVAVGQFLAAVFGEKVLNDFAIGC
jgi:hypothetical protein